MKILQVRVYHSFGLINGITFQIDSNSIQIQFSDNAGIKEAFRAYQEFERDNGPEPALPGLPYSSRQLFWISAANIWCGKYRPEVLKLRVQVGSHSPAQFRVVGTVSNLQEFADTFNCPAGSPMYPLNRCAVW